MPKRNFGKQLSLNSKNNPGDELRKIEASIDGYEKYILHSEMRPSEDNKYPIGSLDDLKDSLTKRPLLHNLIVIPVEEEEYKYYKILAGERRWRAIGELLSEGNEKFKSGIRCLVISKDTPEIDQKIIMEESNLNQREYTPKERREALDRLAELYRQKNKIEGKDDNITKLVAEKAGIGERQVQRYITINDNLIPELKTALDESKIKVEEAAKFANMDEDSQRFVVGLLESNREVTKKEIELIKAETKKKEEELLKKISVLELEVSSADETNKRLNEDLELKDKQIKENLEQEESLRKQIEEELSTNQPDQERLEILQKEIEKLKVENHEKECEKEDINKQLDQQQRELNSLRKELQQAHKLNNEKSSIALSEEEQNKLREKFEITNIYTDIKKSLNQLLVKSETYKKKYKELPVEEYYDEIIKKIEADMKKIMKGEA